LGRVHPKTNRLRAVFSFLAAFGRFFRFWSTFMKKTLIVAVLLMAVAACFAHAAPDAYASVVAFLADPHAGGSVMAFGPLVRGLQAKHADTVGQMRALTDKAEAADRDLSAEEVAQFDALKASAESLKARITRAQEQELAEAGLSAGAAATAASNITENVLSGRGEGHVVIHSAATLGVTENVDADPNRGFRSFGEYAQLVRGAAVAKQTGVAMDKRLAPLAAAPGTYAGEGSGTDGGILVPPGFSSNIFTLSLGEDALLPMTDNLPIEGNSMLIPKDETTPWGTNGIRAYWQAEGSAGNPTKPLFGGIDLRLKKLMALVPVSDELLSDSTALTSYLPAKVAMSIRWKANEAILFGNGGGVPLGALAGPSLVTVAKDSGQLTGTLSATNLANMIARLPPGSFPNAVWIINNDVLPALFTLTLGNYPIYLPGGATVGGIQSNPYGMLLGRPIIVSQHAKSFSSQGDILLVDLSYYQSITKTEGVVTATSMHLYFDADTMAFRTTFRMDGQPKIVNPITPANGSKTLSPFVQLGAR
jgi:HK97 family phage major capsid protein